MNIQIDNRDGAKLLQELDVLWPGVRNKLRTDLSKMFKKHTKVDSLDMYDEATVFLATRVAEAKAASKSDEESPISGTIMTNIVASIVLYYFCRLKEMEAMVLRDLGSDLPKDLLKAGVLSYAAMSYRETNKSVQGMVDYTFNSVVRNLIEIVYNSE